jgi:ABC-type branched-subunit amino acid transport system substrate-binding protein
MRADPSAVTRFLRAAGALAVTLALAACAAQPGGAGLGAGPAPGGGAASPPAAGPAQVALLLPQSSPEASHQAEARDLEAAARLAAARAGGLIELRVYDTAADPARAGEAATRAVAEGADLILGPVFAQETPAVAAAASAVGVRTISFSPFSGAAGNGAYVMGFAPENEVRRILSYAGAQGLGRVALVQPRGQYGQVVEAAARRYAPATGGAVVATLAYDRTNEGIQQAVRDGAPGLLAAGPDSLLLVDRGQGLAVVAAFLAYSDISPATVRYLGLSGWDTEATFTEPALRGGWFASPDPARREAFAAEFEAANGRRPSPLAALGHDGVVAAAEMLRRARAAGGAAAFSDASIRDPRGFPGAAGAFRFGADGVVDRALAILEVSGRGFTIREPAPAGFAAGS